MGHISFVGKLDGVTLSAGAPTIAPGWTLDLMGKHSLDFWLTSEDLPDPENRVTLDRDGRIVLAYTAEQRGRPQAAHPPSSKGSCSSSRAARCTATTATRGSSPGTSSWASGFRSPASPTRTARSGSAHDPRTSALDVNCRAHEVDNLYVVDGSFFPSSGAVNPALTIMANALRVGDHILERLGAARSSDGRHGGGGGMNGLTGVSAGSVHR